MKGETDNGYFNIVVDPTEHWPDVHPTKLLGLGGNISEWILLYATQEMDQPIEDWLNQCYPFGVHRMTGGTFAEDLNYEFPGDPPLPPAFHFKAKHNGMEFVMYQHAMCAFRDQPEDEWFMTRMD